MSQLPSLSQLRDPNAFLRRHLGPDAAEQQAMLDSLGLGSRVELIEQTVPPGIRLNRMLDLPPALDEEAALAKLRGYAEQNQVWTSLIGMGYHGTLTPTVILRNVLENPGWYTAYTPYQPEIAQGRLEALLNFQQLTIDLTGLELANASLLDEATAAAEAMALAKRVAKSKSNVFFVDENCHPQTISVVQTRAEGFGSEVKRRIMMGTYVLSHGYYDAYYLKAQKLRRLVANDFQTALQSCDLILGPVAPTAAPKLGSDIHDPVQMYLSDIYTIALNLAGLPGMSLPAGFSSDGLPIGVQLIGNYFTEAKLLGVAHQIQQHSDWHSKAPA